MLEFLQEFSDGSHWQIIIAQVEILANLGIGIVSAPALQRTIHDQSLEMF